MRRFALALPLPLIALACLSGARRFAPRNPQTATGSPKVFGPGIESAGPSSVRFVLDRSANVVVVRVWAHDTSQVVYPLGQFTKGSDCYSSINAQTPPARFDAGVHCVELALPVELGTALPGHSTRLADHYILLIASAAPIDTSAVRRQLEELGPPKDTGSTYVHEVAARLMSANDQPWAAYVVGPCRLPAVSSACPVLAGNTSSR
ncbi:MAG TPA: hypothetical protein VG454_09355 [Gemmatimonadales bacterium]|nr:hypothetical protein [Gemmatimonadales bacterium]